MTTKLHWDKDDPATPALIDPLFEDMGIGADDELMTEIPEQKSEASEATKNYLLAILKNWDNDVTMGDWTVNAIPFYHGYLSGLNHNFMHPSTK